MIKLNCYVITLKNGHHVSINCTHYNQSYNCNGFEFINFYINHVHIFSVLFSDVDDIEEFDTKSYKSDLLLNY